MLRRKELMKALLVSSLAAVLASMPAFAASSLDVFRCTNSAAENYFQIEHSWEGGFIKFLNYNSSSNALIGAAQGIADTSWDPSTSYKLVNRLKVRDPNNLGNELEYIVKGNALETTLYFSGT
jgi:hypothetical protein